ncbi:MAG: hypothetical protein IJJ71_13390 [Treponema sp.]|uniref:hypothetical protein n=1 Tax=Treponema sp. TaxID=166 RepID=UPI00345BB4FF|nr:hypothetical protein [Treponema sp.]
MLKLLQATEGYSGADIESVVKEAVEAAFCAPDGERTVTTERLLEVIKNTKSISDTLKDKIEKLRDEYKKYNFKTANGKTEANIKTKMQEDSVKLEKDAQMNIRTNIFGLSKMFASF